MKCQAFLLFSKKTILHCSLPLHLFDLGLTSLSTIFQSYSDGCHWLWTKICEIRQNFKGDLTKFCEIFLNITVELSQYSLKSFFYHVRRLLKP